MTHNTPQQPNPQLAIETARKIRAIGDEASECFIDRDDYIKALVLACISGESLIVLGPPGTAKSDLVRYFAKAVGVKFFRKQMAGDIRRDDLFGPIDPVALAKDRVWTRAWAGMATHPFVFLDEIGKTPGAVLNMLLDAMEEREVTAGDEIRKLPLHLYVSATNETIDTTSPATWDRYCLRVIVKHLTDTDSVMQLVTSRDKMEPAVVDIPIEELTNARLVCFEMAAKFGTMDDAKLILAGMIANIRDSVDYADTSRIVTGRRWLQVVRVAAAHALFSGRTEIHPEDMTVARWILWSDINDYEKVDIFVDEQMGLFGQQMEKMGELLDSLEVELAGAKTLEQVAAVVNKCVKVQESMKGKMDGPWAEIARRITAIKKAANNHNFGLGTATVDPEPVPF